MGTQEQQLLSVSNVSVRYGSGSLSAQAVSGVSFAIHQGETIGLLGESGCGKSTLARSILGLLPPDAHVVGSIHFRNQELTCATVEDLRSIRGAQIALIAQDPAQALNPVLTVGLQVAEIIRSHTRLSRTDRQRRVLEVLRSVGFPNPQETSGRYAHQLSGGERQRAAIAQAIACHPALLIADEATSKLDARLKWELLELFQTLRKQYAMALLLITHEPNVVASYSQRLLVMYAGEVVEAGPTASLLQQPLHPYMLALVQLARERSTVRRVSKPIRFSAIEGELVAPHRYDCCYFEGRCAQRMPDCAVRHPLVYHRTGHEVSCLKYE